MQKRWLKKILMVFVANIIVQSKNRIWNGKWEFFSHIICFVSYFLELLFHKRCMMIHHNQWWIQSQNRRGTDFRNFIVIENDFTSVRFRINETCSIEAMFWGDMKRTNALAFVSSNVRKTSSSTWIVGWTSLPHYFGFFQSSG